MLRNGVIARALRLVRVSLRVLWSPTDMGVAALVIGADGRVVLVRHSYQAGWSLPGGGVDRGEPPAAAILREMGEEIGLVGGTATLAGLYVRREGWATNVIALYRVTGGRVDFKPGWEIRDMVWADPSAPPPGTTPATLRRLAELAGAPSSPHW